MADFFSQMRKYVEFFLLSFLGSRLDGNRMRDKCCPFSEAFQTTTSPDGRMVNENEPDIPLTSYPGY